MIWWPPSISTAQNQGRPCNQPFALGLSRPSYKMMARLADAGPCPRRECVSVLSCPPGTSSRASESVQAYREDISWSQTRIDSESSSAHMLFIKVAGPAIVLFVTVSFCLHTEQNILTAYFCSWFISGAVCRKSRLAQEAGSHCPIPVWLFPFLWYWTPQCCIVPTYRYLPLL